MRFFVAVFASLLVVTASDARPRHDEIHVKVARSIISCDARGCTSARTVERSKTSRQLPTSRRETVNRYEKSVAYGRNLISKARRYLGMTSRQVGVRRTRWCAAFLRHLGVKGVDNRALSFLKLTHVSPQVGSIAVFRRKGGGHVGIVTGFDGKYPIIISGNSYKRRVYEGRYSRIPIAYVSPR